MRNKLRAFGFGSFHSSLSHCLHSFFCIFPLPSSFTSSYQRFCQIIVLLSYPMTTGRTESNVPCTKATLLSISNLSFAFALSMIRSQSQLGPPAPPTGQGDEREEIQRLRDVIIWQTIRLRSDPMKLDTGQTNRHINLFPCILHDPGKGHQVG